LFMEARVGMMAEWRQLFYVIGFTGEQPCGQDPLAFNSRTSRIDR
jgi:hypothetical protein